MTGNYRLPAEPREAGPGGLRRRGCTTPGWFPRERARALAPVHHSRPAEHIRPANPLVERTLEQLAQLRIVRGGTSSAVGHDQAFALLGNLVRSQARLRSYLDVFWIFWVLTCLALPLVFLMKRSVARGAAVVVH